MKGTKKQTAEEKRMAENLLLSLCSFDGCCLYEQQPSYTEDDLNEVNEAIETINILISNAIMRNNESEIKALRRDLARAKNDKILIKKHLNSAISNFNMEAITA